MLGLKPVAHLIQLPPQILVFDVRINFRRLDVGMTERRLHGAPAPADVKKLCGERMPNIVEMKIFYPGERERRSPSSSEVAEFFPVFSL